MKEALAGTLESGDILVQISPTEQQGVQIELQSTVAFQFGEQIKHVISETLNELGIDRALVRATDKGALDCTVVARTKAAAYRAANSTDYKWAVRR